MHVPGVMPVMDYMNNEKMVAGGMITRNDVAHKRGNSECRSNRSMAGSAHMRSKTMVKYPMDGYSQISKPNPSMVSGFSKKSTISALKKQLDEERAAREKIQGEMEQLKMMSSEINS